MAISSLPELDFRDASFRRSPHQAYARAREISGLARARGMGAYVATRHETCVRLLKDARIGLDTFAGVATDHPLQPYFQMREGLMLFANAPRHTALRAPAQEAFHPRIIKRYEPLVRQLAQSAVREFSLRIAAGESVDFVREVSQPFVSQVICAVVGMPAQDHALLAAMTQKVANGLDPFGAEHDLLEAGKGYRAFLTYMRGQLGQDRWRREASEFTETFLGDIAHCPHMRGGFAHQDDLISTTVMLLAAGHLTTNHSLSLALSTIVQGYPALLLGEGSAITPLLVEELFRYHSPAQITRRVVRESLQVDGHTLHAGQALWVALVSANRDERVFTAPQELDFTRQRNPHVAFGAGTHFCLGTHLARLQLRVFLQELVGQVPGIRVVEQQEDYNLVFRGLKKLVLAAD